MDDDRDLQGAAEPSDGRPACNLTQSEWRRRGADWSAVVSEGLVARAAIPGGVRLTFRPDPAVAHDLLELVAAERSCCGWASWALLSTAESSVLEVTAPAAGAGTVRQWFGVTA